MLDKHHINMKNHNFNDWFSSHPHTSFSPLEFPFLPLVLNFGTRFLNFFLPWTQTSEHISRNFWRIWTRKTSISKFRSFWSRVKPKYWGVKRVGKKRIFYFLLVDLKKNEKYGFCHFVRSNFALASRGLDNCQSFP
jgi:hypothetical protein